MFGLVPYRETGTFVLQAVDEIQAVLDDQIVKTQTMIGSPFIGPFEQQARAWEQRLRLMQEIIDVWLKVQATWLYLEPIFGSPDIMRQMPTEGKRFQTVDRTFRTTMDATNRVRASRGVVLYCVSVRMLCEILSASPKHYGGGVGRSSVSVCIR